MYKRNCEITSDAKMPEGMHRIALGIEYDGSSFFGFQKQSHTPNTIQEQLEIALSKVANEPLALVCAGRTDSGVHASGQVVHFDTLAKRPLKAWVQGVNTQLPHAVRVRWARSVKPEFHARFSAQSRTYRYVFFVSEVRPAILHSGVTWVKKPLDFEKMHRAAQALVGEYDFSSFRSSQCQASHARRCIHSIRFYPSGHFMVMEIKANAFLHHMVRNIVGALLVIGWGKMDCQWLTFHRERMDRSLGPPTAPGDGLYLVAVEYAAEYGLPQFNNGPCFIHSL